MDAELLAGHVLSLSRGEVQIKGLTGSIIDEAAAGELEVLVAERARRVPLQHLTGTAPFRTLELRVGPGAFIPRPETETVVDVVLAEIDRIVSQGAASARIVDLGTGTGAIAAAVAAERPQCEVHAVEVSADAAAWAELNFARLPEGSAGVTLHQQDLRDFAEGGFDVVVSNPPYIPSSMVPADPEVHAYDPETALYGGGEDGLELPRAVISTAERVLVPGGLLILEHAEVQAEELRRICSAAPDLDDVCTHEDFTGRPRATSARHRPGANAQEPGDGMEEYRA
ncbi:peptide chain release factor N(5)-glutamine methyltransferase [Nesterenkonia populi]